MLRVGLMFTETDIWTKRRGDPMEADVFKFANLFGLNGSFCTQYLDRSCVATNHSFRKTESNLHSQLADCLGKTVNCIRCRACGYEKLRTRPPDHLIAPNFASFATSFRRNGRVRQRHHSLTSPIASCILGIACGGCELSTLALDWLLFFHSLNAAKLP